MPSEGSPAAGGDSGRDVRRGEKQAPAHRPAPGRLGERAEATAVDLPGGCCPEAQRGRRAWGCLEPRTPTSPPHPVDGRARGAGPGPAEAPQLFRDTGPQRRRVGGGGAAGERAFRRQRLRLGAVGVGRRLQGLCRNTCISREWVFGGFGFRSQHLPVPLCVRGLARLSRASIPAPQPGAWLWGPVGAPRVSAYVVCACRRVWVGCPWGMCARSEPELPRLSASPAVHCFPPTWLQTFLWVPPATPAGCPPFSLSPPEVLRAAREWDRIGGSGVICSPWRLARARIGRSMLDTLTGP